MGSTQIAQGGRKVIRFETRRGDGALVDPDNFNAGNQATWPTTLIKDGAGNVLAWKPSDSGDDPAPKDGLFHYGTGQWGQEVLVPSGATIASTYRLEVSATIGGQAASGSDTFSVVVAGSIPMPPAGLVDRAYVLRVIGPKSPESYGYSVQTDLDVLVDEAILAASGLVARYCERSFVQESKTIKVDILDSEEIAIKLPGPLKAITSLTEAGVALTEGTHYSFRSNGFVYRHDASGEPKAWPRGIGKVVIAYTEGDSDVPAEVKWATARIVEGLLSNIVVKRKTPFIQVGEWELAVPEVWMLPRDILDALRPHRRLAAGAV